MSLSTITVKALRQLLKEKYTVEDDLNGSLALPNMRFQPSREGEYQPLSQSSLLNTKLKQKSNENTQNYNRILISKLSCEKISNFSVRGGNIEIMGILMGFTLGDHIVIMDCFNLPVVGTETRVNAQLESYEYMVQYIDEMYNNNVDSDAQDCKEVQLNVVGWFHSHPGYDCWLSNIDIQTQDLNQRFQDPYVAIVVDPLKSLKDGTLKMGAFRTVENQNGDVNALSYYELETIVFDSELNRTLFETKLKLHCVVEDDESEQMSLNRLIETMKQCNYLVDSKNVRTRMKLATNDNVHDENKKTVDDQNHLTKSQFYCNTQKGDSTGTNSFVSMLSGDNNSDVDMEDRNFTEFDSTDTSLYTSMEPSLHANRTETNNRSNENFHNLRNHFNISQDRHKEECNDLLQRNVLETDYTRAKNRILASKIKQYERLRFYKDTFTL
ncbi:COP9 signalosome catalytic subunit RRI1 [Saccharomyces eubayanus]|uniref:COP9 signalosome catalytic subunit RRI1 n=1 Tax=Saccharomyces eubayanus TaxID=1080349 RepID=UPI0006C29D40|nr:RRI1-like protein [Saccharomyces eubayanus]KOH00165.1 RRI1-like protein [Saccharomyces eubayanus]